MYFPDEFPFSSNIGVGKSPTKFIFNSDGPPTEEGLLTVGFIGVDVNIGSGEGV